MEGCAILVFSPVEYGDGLVIYPWRLRIDPNGKGEAGAPLVGLPTNGRGHIVTGRLSNSLRTRPLRMSSHLGHDVPV